METKVSVTICSEKACEQLKDVIVDTGATLSAINRKTAKLLGIQATRRERFRTAEGTRDFDVGLASLTIQGRQVRQEVAILDEGPAVVGVLTLEQARFKVDSTEGRLEPAGPANLIQIMGLNQPAASQAYWA
jgi:predicted aspartyl protease